MFGVVSVIVCTPSKNVKAVGVTSTPTLGGRASANVTIRVTNMSVVKTRQVTVQLTRDVPLLLDGERVVGKKAEISFVSDAVNVIVPKPNQGILLFTDFKCNFLQRGVRIY
jgi:diacylglycerol kinase family enzyme